MAHWNHYFHFPTGTKFYIDGPWGYNGNGAVLENSPSRLVLRMDLAAWGPAPAFHARISVDYRQEGPGNTAVVEEDGKPPQQDNNATVISDDGRRERAITSGPATFSVRYDGDDEVDFDIHINGKSWDFDLQDPVFPPRVA